MESLLFEGEVLLEKMNMKGGWTYALLPEVIKGGKNHFGWARVNAVIDGYEMNNASLMPIKGGRLFLAIKAAIRREIKKEAGDKVIIKLYGNRPVATVSESDFMDSLADDPAALNNYGAYPKKEQKNWLTWIFAGADNEEKIERMAVAINEIAGGKFCKAMEKKK